MVIMGENYDAYSVFFENHKKILADNISNFLSRQAFVDVTLVCNGGGKIKVHRAVLAASSPFFEKILLDIDGQNHPAIILIDIPEALVALLVEFIYKGKAEIPREVAPIFLKVARRLQIRGLKYEVLMKSKEDLSASKKNKSSRATVMQNPPAVSNTVKEPEQQELPKERLPWKITTETGIVKVLNPFALKRTRQDKDSDSTSIEEDLCAPGPSKTNDVEEAVSSAADKAPEEDDSDIEFIDDYPSVVVVNDTQIVESPEWLNKNQTTLKRPLSRNPASDMEYETDESEVIASVPRKKKQKSPLRSDLEESTEAKDAEKNRSSKEPTDHQELSDRSESPELVTVAAKDVPKAMTDTVKKEGINKLTETAYLQRSFCDLAKYCVICKTFKKNTMVHVRRLHSAPIRRKKYTCKTCSKIFYMKYTLEIHKCTT